MRPRSARLPKHRVNGPRALVQKVWLLLHTELPGVLLQEAHRGVERRAAPHFQAEEIGDQPGRGAGHRHHVVGANPRGEQRLMGVTEGRVGHEHPLLAAHPCPVAHTAALAGFWGGIGALIGLAF